MCGDKEWQSLSDRRGFGGRRDDGIGGGGGEGGGVGRKKGEGDWV